MTRAPQDPRRTSGDGVEHGRRAKSFAPRTDEPLPPDAGLPTDRALFADEVERIRARVEKVVREGRELFFDGSGSYDHATVAVLRLAALFNDGRFGPFLTAATDTERRGIPATRNIAAHRGCASMNDDVFWETVTVQVPRFLDKVQNASGL
ncbi:antitoxin [Microbacterium sp.]|uniref:antitoxin n=1 Tax=Microbacterium sp. TaxID=51671 RepID=UPI003A9471DC